MNTVKLFFLFLFSSVFLFQIQTAHATETITAIEVHGNKIIDTAAIEVKLSSKVGDKLDNDKISNDIKELYNMGSFSRIDVLYNKTGVLIFEVEERPIIGNVYLEGNDAVGDETFKEKMGGSIRRFFDERKIHAGVADVLKLYQEKGFKEAKIDYTAQKEDGGQVDLTFEFDEGGETLIREVTFEGNDNIEASDLRGVVETGRYKWWSSWMFGTGVVQKDLLARDVSALHEFYLTKGYAQVRVTDPEIIEVENGLKVIFKIDEGKQFTINSVSASGTLFEDSEEKTLEGIELKKGDIFDVSLMRKDVFRIRDKFGNIGYAFANVLPESQINTANATIDLRYIINKGQEVYINRINIIGNTKTRDNVVRRDLKIEEGDLYSASKIERTRALLERTGFFDEVTIDTEQNDVADDKLDLDINLKEGRTGTFNIGVGASTSDGLILMAKLSENNIFGTGNNISLDLDTGTIYSTYRLGFLNPRINDTQWSGGVDAYMMDREYDDFSSDQKGFSISAGYPLWFLSEKYLDDIRFNLSYELSWSKIYDVKDDAAQLVKDQSKLGECMTSAFTPKLIRNTINNPLDPTSGSRQVLSYEFAGVGGDEKYWLFGALNTIYVPLIESRKLVFSNRIRFDYGEVYGSSDTGTLPIFKRFFPGGINSVRGYKAYEMGPRDANGHEYGGNKQFIMNNEIIFPLLSGIGLKGVVFYDMGQAFDEEHNINFSDLKLAWGWGFRWNTMMAPIRLEFGYPISPDKYDRKGMVVNFTFGMPQ